MTLILAEQAYRTVAALKTMDHYRLRKVVRALRRLDLDPFNPDLRTKRLEALDRRLGETLFESCVESEAANCWRIWWFFGPGDDDKTVVDVGASP